MEEYFFKEDARTYRKPVVILTIILYIAFCGFFGTVLGLYIEHEIEKRMLLKLVCLASILLIFAIYFTWGLASKYLKYYMFINNYSIKFYCNKRDNQYSIEELMSYSVKNTRGRYTVFQLNFHDGKNYEVTSFKAQEFEAALRKIINFNK